MGLISMRCDSSKAMSALPMFWSPRKCSGTSELLVSALAMRCAFSKLLRSENTVIALLI